MARRVRTAAIVAVLGLIAAISWMAIGTSGAMRQVEDFARAPIPGATAVQVSKLGTVVAYVEASGSGTSYTDPDRRPYRTA